MKCILLMSLHNYFHLEVESCFSVKFLLEDQESDATLGTVGALLAAVVDCNSTWSCGVSF